MSTVLTVDLLNRMVRSVCSHPGYRASSSIAGIELCDLQQEAALAVLRASKSFDADKGSIEATCIVSAHRAVADYLRRNGAPPIRAKRSQDLNGTKSIPFHGWELAGEEESDIHTELFRMDHFTKSFEADVHDRMMVTYAERRLYDMLGDDSGICTDFLSGYINQETAAAAAGLPPSTFYWRIQRALRIIRAEGTP